MCTMPSDTHGAQLQYGGHVHVVLLHLLLEAARLLHVLGVDVACPAALCMVHAGGGELGTLRAHLGQVIIGHNAPGLNSVCLLG